MDLKDLQPVLLESLAILDEICKKNNLQYFMIGGTFLGAVRHKGFIPWDDDIDIAMPRDSYEKLIDIFNDNCEKKYIRLYNYKKDDNMRCYFSRLIIDPEYAKDKKLKLNDSLGLVAIDILPLDGTPNNKFLRKIYYFKCMFYRMLGGISNLDIKEVSEKRAPIDKFILKFSKITKLYKLINRKKIFNKLDKIYSNNSWKKSNYSGTITGRYKTKEIVDTSFWGEGTRYNFENYVFIGPDKYNDYLTHMYGDYMKLPPEKNRDTHFDN